MEDNPSGLVVQGRSKKLTKNGPFIFLQLGLIFQLRSIQNSERSRGVPWEGLRIWCKRPVTLGT